MANIKSAKKRAHQSEKRRLHNQSQKSTMRTAIKKVLKAVEQAQSTVAEEAFRLAASTLDKMARKGLIHKNKAARHKSRLHARIKKLTGNEAPQTVQQQSIN